MIFPFFPFVDEFAEQIMHTFRKEPIGFFVPFDFFRSPEVPMGVILNNARNRPINQTNRLTKPVHDAPHCGGHRSGRRSDFVTAPLVICSIAGQ